MLNRWRLPPDNFPDETETNAFQNYREGQRRVGEVFSRLFGSRGRVLFTIGVFIALVGSTWLVLYTFFPQPTVEIVVTSEATVIVESIGGDFPESVSQEVISIPARIEDSLAFGTRRGYRFYAEAGVEWKITVSGEDEFYPAISLYGPPNGQLMADGQVVYGLTSEIRVMIEQDGTYAVLLEGSGAVSDGEYTLLIVPVQ